MTEKNDKIRDNWFTRVGAWLSQGVNCIFLFGHHDQTVSARAFLNREERIWGYVYKTINFIVFWESDHCYESYMRDVSWASHIFRTRRDDKNRK